MRVSPPSASFLMIIAFSPSVTDLAGAQPERQRDLVVRPEEALPPRPAGDAPDAHREQLQALVLPELAHVEVRGVFVDEGLYQRAGVADVAGLVAYARPMVDARE